MDFTGWALCLPRWVLATRSDFGWHLLRSFSLKWHGKPMLSAVYPLPAPFPGCFDGSGPGLSKRKLGVVARKRLCHTLIIVLNYLALGRFATPAELGRPPNGMQTRCIRRLYDMVTACGYRPDRFPVVPGRSGFELIACLDRLERFLDDATTFGHGYDICMKLPLARDHDLEEKQMEEHPQLRPFRPLCAERLKITGCGKWPLEDYLESVLWLPYVEPGILRHGADVSHLPGPVFGSEDRSENLRLARKWDELGLLRLHSCPSEDWPFSRVFNIYKSEQVDRQIGDRRNMNKVECHAGGPSSRLPPGPLLVNLFCLRGRQNLRGSVTDRRDFYHQAKASKSRSLSNLLPFGYRRDELVGLSALSAFEEENLRKAKGRLYEGDHFESRRGLLVGGEEHLFCGFAALFHGDHLGVEFALEGHETLLRGEGLLHEPDRLQGHSVLPLDECYEALIIDDYFCISAQGREVDFSSSESFKRLQRARLAYQNHGLPGSPEKDVVAETLFKAAGAEVDSNEAVVELGLCLVGAPLQKRLALSLASLRTASLRGISSQLAARLSGSWVSVLLYRRPLSSIVSDLFAVGAGAEMNLENVVVPLTRKVAQELAMLAAVVPLLVTDVSAPVDREIFATDASLQKGAFVSTVVSEQEAKALWLGCDKKGSYSKLDNPFKCILRSLGGDIDYDSEDEDVGPGRADPVPKPPLFYFDFVEICGGAGQVSAAMSALGFVVAPVLDLSLSSFYNLSDIRLLEWIFHMLLEKRFGSSQVEPPCTTFSPAAHPAVRSYDVPVGWDRLLPKVLIGNTLAFRSLLIMWFSKRCRRPCMLEQPHLSKMAWLSAWRWLLSQGCSEAVVASCMLGSIHRKQFRLLLSDIDAEDLNLKCSGGHEHVRIEGRFTKASAVYTEGVAMHFAKAFSKALKIIACEEIEEEVFDGPAGKESLLVNDLLRSGDWKLARSWAWKTKSHINLLEMNVVLSLQKQKLQSGISDRHCILLDSLVSKGAFAKGRSSSRALQAVLQRSAAYQVAGGQYPGFCYAPTKLNVADDPSRGVPIREPCQWSVRGFLDLDFLRSEAGCGLSRSRANWIRIVALASCLLPSSASFVSLSEPSSHCAFGSSLSFGFFYRIFAFDSEIDFSFAPFYLWQVYVDALDFLRFGCLVCPAVTSLGSAESVLSVWIFALLCLWALKPPKPRSSKAFGCNFHLGVFVFLSVCVCVWGEGRCHGTSDFCREFSGTAETTCGASD